MPTTPSGPWLIAAWPGMGSVAIIAAGYLVQKLGMKPEGAWPGDDHFDVEVVEVHNGMVMRPRLPRLLLYRWKPPQQERELLVLLADAQPASRAYAFAHKLLDRATSLGVERIITFASMASQLHPTEDPAVYAVATDPRIREEISRFPVHPLERGQISGLNGLLLGAAAERELPGVCLMGEIPFFAARVSNPKAARAVLNVFAQWARIDVDLADLDAHAETTERELVEMLERMRQALEEDEEDEESTPPEQNQSVPRAAEDKSRQAPTPHLDAATQQRIEQMFHEATKDRSKAVRLKEELDRLGVFHQYEDRFLDLFRRAE